MAIHGSKHCDLMKLMVLLSIACIVMFFVQSYVYKTETSPHKYNHNQQLHVHKLRVGEAGIRMTTELEAVSAKPKLKVKTILMHTMPYWHKLKSGREAFSTCDYPCTLTLDPEMVGEVDSVVVHSHNFRLDRSPWWPRDQVWVFFATESPLNSRNSLFQRAEWHNRFNWTMTYRRDSDFYFGYGDFIKPQSSIPARNFSEIVAGKSKMAAWFVSNCNARSNRKQFADTLSNFIQVDVYGRCGPLKCGKEGNMDCMNMLSKDYYFYLSLENSICNDYLTEKVYRTMKLIDIIPVVMGGANYSAILPNNSYIDVKDFPSVKALANYLKKVARDRKLYESYLTWKNEWQVIAPIPFSFCEFCRHLHHPERWAKVYPDIDAWWVNGQCYTSLPVVES